MSRSQISFHITFTYILAVNSSMGHLYHQCTYLMPSDIIYFLFTIATRRNSVATYSSTGCTEDTNARLGMVLPQNHTK